MRLARAPSAAGLLLAALLAAACTDTSADEGLDGTPTVVAVEPEDFLGAVACTPSAGGMQTFVATVRDETAQFPLGSSPPVSCSTVAQFLYVVPGHSYSAEIDAYDVGLEPGEIQPEHGPSSKDRVMVGPGGVRLEPRWTTKCIGPAQSVLNQTVFVAGCEALVLHGDPSATGIAVDPAAALGGLACESEPGGAVATFDVVPDSPALPPRLDVACGEQPEPYLADVEAGTSYGFRLDARANAGGTIRWRSRCFTVAEEGLVVGVSCDALSDQGGLLVSPTEDGVPCPTGGSYTVKLYEAEGGELSVFTFPPFECGVPATLDGLPSGAYSVTIEVLDKDGASPVCAECTTTVVPFETASATCAVEPCK